jgi:hypothetical protein
MLTNKCEYYTTKQLYVFTFFNGLLPLSFGRQQAHFDCYVLERSEWLSTLHAGDNLEISPFLAPLLMMKQKTQAVPFLLYRSHIEDATVETWCCLLPSITFSCTDFTLDPLGTDVSTARLISYSVHEYECQK